MCVKTTVYHTQSNGVLERLHATLESILTKAHKKGLDWVKELPFALFTLPELQALVLMNIRTLLDVLCEGWRDEVKQG